MLRIRTLAPSPGLPLIGVLSRIHEAKADWPVATSRRLYGFIPADCAGEIMRAPPSGPRLDCIRAGRVAALVGPPALDLPVRNKVRHALRRLRTYQQALEGVMRRVPVLPAHFTARLPDRATIARVIKESEEQLSRAINAYGHLLQVEILVTGGDAQAGSRATAARGSIRLDLKGLSLAMREEAVEDRRILLWLTLLIRSMDEPRLDAALVRLDGEYGGWLHFKCVGPLPPCNFVRAQVLRAGLPNSSPKPHWMVRLSPSMHHSAEPSLPYPPLSARRD